ncbi:MAG: ADP-ribosylation factor-like protein [Candidatus Kariarchaeaceae archaeon]|jgi:small GTP-binding protein
MQESVITIRTLECDICGRFDSVMLSLEEIQIRSKTTDMGIGAYSIVHTDHTRIIYFDETGQYLGDTIALTADDIPENLQTQPLPYYIRNSSKISVFKKLRKSLFSKLHTRNLTITIVGPSRAGKTSLVRYLETLIPERDSAIVPSVPTMGKSTKHVKLGKSLLKTLDMGGQQDFWDIWENAIKKSHAVFYILDGTSNNLLEVAKAFERVIHYRDDTIPILVIMNKKDLVLRGEANRFISSGEFLSLTNLKLPLKNVVSIESSVFEGIVYDKAEYEEIPLAQVITSFLDDCIV